MGRLKDFWNLAKNTFSYNVPTTRKTLHPSRSFFQIKNRDLATNETVFSAISSIANAVASAPISVRKNYQCLNMNEHYLAELFDFGPNSYQTTFQFIRLMETIRNVKGRAYAIKEFHNSARRKLEVKALYILDSDRVTPFIDSDTKEKYYQIIDDNGGRYAIHSDYIIEVNHISTNGLESYSPLDVLRNTIDYDTKIKEFSLNQMTNSLSARLVVKLQSKLSEENLELYQKMMEDFMRSGILYVDSGKEFQELKNTTYIDPNVAAVENITIERVERVFNMAGKLTGKADDVEDLIYLKDCILPIIRMYEQEFTKKLVSYNDRRNGIRIKFNMNGFARGNMKTRGEFYNKMIRSSAFCANDIRAWEDLPPIEGGDVFYVSRDMCPIDQIRQLIDSAGTTNTDKTGTDTTGGIKSDDSKGDAEDLFDFTVSIKPKHK